jgi:hypothetical protein
MPSPTLADYVLVTLWGWPGILAALLGAWHAAERLLRWTPLLSGRAKLAVVAAGLAVGLAFTARGVSLPAHDLALGAEIERHRRESARSARSPASRVAAERIADRLRRELPTNGR